MCNLLKSAFCGILAVLLSPLSQALVVGSYNIRYSNEPDVARGNGWPQRLPVVAGLIRFHGFDVLGTQEAHCHQLADLKELMPDYDYLGVGRDDGERKGEYAAIFYKKTKFTVLDSGTFWLSATPKIPSIGWDADRSRICTWAKFKPIDGSEVFYAFNTHLDHRGSESRIQSIRLIMRAVKTIADGEKAFVTGDFNFDQVSRSYKEISESGLFFDSFTTAEECYALNGTTNGFTINTRSENRIDHVFHTKQFKPRRYGVLTDSYRAPAEEEERESGMSTFPVEVKFKNYQAKLPSDHFPILVEFE